jgi:hypothetical protein
MKIIDGSWSVVIVGKWNRYILTPQWVGKNIFNQENIEVQFPINQPELAPRYKSPTNIIFLPAIHKCQFIAQEPYDDTMLSNISQYIRKLASMLEHTPVTALGINFGFEEESHNFQQIDMFNLTESDRYIDMGLHATLTGINRMFTVDNHPLNLNVEFNQERNKVIFEFNFHYNITIPAQICELVTPNLIIDNKKKALSILHDIYELQLEIDKEDDQ